MKQIFYLPVIVCGILCGCASENITPAPGAPEQSVQEYVKKHWKNIASPHPVLYSVKWKMSREDSEKQFAGYQNILKKYAPHMLAEYAAIDQALNWENGTYLRKSFYGLNKKATLKRNKKITGHECTSWAVLPDKAADNQLLLHKNRDTDIRKTVIVHRIHPEKYAYIGLCDIGLLDVTMGMNSVGLVFTVNSGDKSDAYFSGGLDTTQLGRILLENCRTAEEAVMLLQKMISDNAYTHGQSGSIWLIADKDCVFAVEHDTKRFAFQKTENGCVIRANTWLLPEMLPYSQKSVKGAFNSRGRERAILNVLFDSGKKHSRPVTPEIMAQAARCTLIPGAPKEYPPCGKRTVSGATFSIDREFPADLSTVYAATGSPAHTLFLPIPITACEIPSELLDQEHSKKIDKLQAARKKLFSDRKQAEIEAVLRQNHHQARENARKILRRDFSEAARLQVRKMMNAAFKENCRIFQAAFQQ